MLDSFRGIVDRARIGFAIAAESVRQALRGDDPTDPPPAARIHDEFIVTRLSEAEIAEMAKAYELSIQEANTPELSDPAELDFAMLHPEDWPSVRAAAQADWRKAARAWRQYECDATQAAIYRAQESAGGADSNPGTPRLNLRFDVTPIRTDGIISDQSWRK